jgi:large subunit ribosomal protein L17
MRHLKKSRRFGRKPTHRKAMFNNMVTSLFLHERLLTTLEKAKELRRLAEKLITLGKRGTIAARRIAARRLQTTGRKEGKQFINEEKALQNLFETIAPRYADRPGGYTRIIRTGRRLGDNAAMAFIELLPEERKAAPKGKGKKGKKGGAKKPAKKTAKAKPAKKAAAKKDTAKKPAKKAAKKTAKKASKE